MRKLMVVSVLAVILVPLFAAVALADGQLVQCKTYPCYGEGNYDKILERVGNGVPDKIIAGGGHDLILANKYTNDKDVVNSGKGYDKINVADRDTLDTANGGNGGHDWCIVDSRSEVGAGCDRVTVR
jgi:hypothetical protein